MEITIQQPALRLVDPHVSSDDPDARNILHALYEPLVRRNRNGTYDGLLASDWHVQTDGRTWCFTLRNDIACHNGDILQADDVVATMQRVLDPNMGGELGTQGIYSSYLGDARFTALDATHVQIVTAEPLADLLDLLVLIPIVPRRALDGLPDMPVGSGPFRLATCTDHEIVLEPFAEYWGEASPVQALRWRAKEDAATRVQQLLAGQVDVITKIGPEQQTAIVAQLGDEAITSQPSSVCVIFMCNAFTGVCTDSRVRKALNYGLDKERLIAEAMLGFAHPLNGPITAHHFGYDPELPAYPYDPALALSLLTEAGFPEGLQLTLDVPDCLPDEAQHLARMMAAQYAEIGIETEVRVFTDRPGYAEMVRAKQIDDACSFDSSPLSTFRILREKFHSGLAGPWWLGYDNPKVNALIDQAQTTFDVEERRQLYQQAHRLIHADAPWIFLYNPITLWGINPAVNQHVQITVDGLLEFA